MRSTARGFAVGALLAAAFLDLVVAQQTRTGLALPALVLAVGLTAVLRPLGSLQLRTVVPALLSLLYTATSVIRHRDVAFGPGEVAVLLCLLYVAVRYVPARWAGVCGALDAGAVLAMPARYFRTPWAGDEGPVYLVVGLVLVGSVAGFAGYLRALDFRRAVAVAETRRQERVAIAADLHDFVAHHVTGILVQTQMARMLVAGERERVDPVLGGIQDAATEALASMRRTVGVLRESDSAAMHPVGDLAGIRGLVRGFAGQPVVLRRDAAVHDDLPHEVQAAAFRVVQEALTNVRRHAGDAGRVAVGLRLVGTALEVTVVDDGRGGVRLPEEARGGGFGLVGLRERVTALGGELEAGPEVEGWRVRAVLPVRGR
ncbi:sensor histidine kinase [Streptomyces acidiscabies]|uniref:histidine kinase n=1 Tax=Streptomyces acidiscabies TaxID=42234 RepID=A0AAP6BHL2_9ACTN|nr:histidine kinase [Streptomyces acidiscabies]MBZ3917344.1 two-component sensor histidine kinase [Streptomyces acidiscabies]MDX2964869.1 histidine kinase [Streptomyces acidiscabies]MDX3023370.1 histidine kinase [Streptomyces acidiscabies]